MNIIKNLGQRVKNLSLVDISLIKVAVFFATLIIVKIFPGLTDLSYPVLISFVIITAIRPFYVFWFKK